MRRALLPFNRLFDTGDALVADFNSRVCPLRDVAEARTGQGWQELSAELAAEPAVPALTVKAKLPAGATKVGWRQHEELVRDAIAVHLDQRDYAAFAAFQEEAVIALAQSRPAPEAGAPAVMARAQRLRETLLQRWRALFGTDKDAGLPAAARTAARQAALLTASWRFDGLLRQGADPSYTTEIQRLPRSILATSFLVELGVLSRRRPPGLRAATEARPGGLATATLLGYFDRRARLHAPIAHPAGPSELHDALDALSAALKKGDQPLGAAAQAALAVAPPELRGLAFSALANCEAQLEIG